MDHLHLSFGNYTWDTSGSPDNLEVLLYPKIDEWVNTRPVAEDREINHGHRKGWIHWLQAIVDIFKVLPHLAVDKAAVNLQSKGRLYLGYTGERIYTAACPSSAGSGISKNVSMTWLTPEERGLNPADHTPNADTHLKFTQPGRFQEAMELLGEDSSDDTVSPGDLQPDEEESHRQLEQDLKFAPNAFELITHDHNILVGMTAVTQAGLIDQWEKMTNILYPGAWKNNTSTIRSFLVISLSNPELGASKFYEDEVTTTSDARNTNPVAENYFYAPNLRVDRLQLVKVILIATTPKAIDRLLESWLDFNKRAGMKKFNESEFLRPYRSIQERTQPDYADVENDFLGFPATDHSIIAQKYEDLKSNIMSRRYNHRDYSLQEKSNARAMKAAQLGDVFLRDWNDADDDDTSA
ncbi:MAG: hypothetical protein Q9215_003486 [Flavoplaca cf. flavocitrina]